MKAVIKILDRYFRVFSYLTYALLAIVIIMVVIDVGARWIFGRPLPDTIEIIRLFLPMITFLPLAFTLTDGKHINVAAVTDRLPVRLRKASLVIAFTAGFVCMVIITWGCWKYFLTSWAVLELASGATWYVPVYAAKFSVFLGTLSMAIAYVLQIYKVIKGEKV